MNDHKGLYTWCHSHIPTVREAIATGEPFKPRCVVRHVGQQAGYAWQCEVVVRRVPRDRLHHRTVSRCSRRSTSRPPTSCSPLREWLEEPIVEHDAQLNTSWLQNECVHIGETVSHTIPAAQVIARCKEKWGGTMPAAELRGYIGQRDRGRGARQAWRPRCTLRAGKSLSSNTDKYVPCVMIRPRTTGTTTSTKRLWTMGCLRGSRTESRKFEVYLHRCCSSMARTGYPFCYPYEQEALVADYSPICDLHRAVRRARSMSDERVPLRSHERPRAVFPSRHHAPCRVRPRAVPDGRDSHKHPPRPPNWASSHMDWVKVHEPPRRSACPRVPDRGRRIRGRYGWSASGTLSATTSPSRTTTAGWRECNVNVLTKNDAPFNEVFGSYTNRGFTVKIEKSEKPANVWVEPEEFEPFMPTLQMLRSRRRRMCSNEKLPCYRPRPLLRMRLLRRRLQACENAIDLGVCWNHVSACGPSGYVSRHRAVLAAHAVSAVREPPLHRTCARPAPRIATRTTGIVLVDEEDCIGCQICMTGLPVRRALAQHENQRRREVHAVLPSDRLTRTRACRPACTTAAAARAIFGDLDDPESDASKAVAAALAKDSESVHHLPDPGDSHPATVYILSKKTAEWKGLV